jgi:catechol 2,3-dioxygenase-like lactoylglutathione lyase family enzyme
VKIKLTSVYVDDQEKALRFYTKVLGFVKKADFTQGPFRWLTVASSEDPDGTELQLALNDNPAAKKPTSRRCSSKTSPRPCSSPTTCRPITSG